MINPLHILAAILSTGRLVTLFASDRITEGMRKRLSAYYIVSCQYCLSVWAGIAATVMLVFFPWGNWPFALSWLYIVWLSVLKRRKEIERERTGKTLKIILKDGQVTWANDLSPQELEQSLIAIGLLTPVQQGRPT